MRRSAMLGSVLLSALAGCGGGGGGGTSSQPVPTYTISGQLSGLRSPGVGLTLAASTGETLKVLYDGAFSFTTPVPQGTAYQVSVQTQPTRPDQVCTVGNGSGTATGNVSVTVTCTTPSIVNILVANGTGQGDSDGVIRGFVLDPATGALTARSAEPAPGRASTIVWKAATQEAYVARWDTTNGDFSSTSWGRGTRYKFDILGVPKGDGPTSGGDQIGLNPVSGLLYALTPGETSQRFPERFPSYKAGRVYAFGTQDPIATTPAVGRGLRRLAFDPAGSGLFVTGDGDGVADQQRIYTLSLADPNAPAVTGSYTPAFLPYAIAARPIGRFLYVTAPAGVLGYAFSYSATGTLTPLGSGFAAPLDARAALVSADGSRLYLAGTTSGQVQCYAIGSDGLPVPRGAAIAAGTRPVGLTFDPDGKYLYVLNRGPDGGDSTISGYVAGNDCSLTPISGLPIAAGTLATAMTAARFTP